MISILILLVCSLHTNKAAEANNARVAPKQSSTKLVDQGHRPGAKQPKTHSDKPKKQKRTLGMGKEVDNLFYVYMKANMRFPQMGIGINAGLATHMMSHPENIRQLFQKMDFIKLGQVSAKKVEAAHGHLLRKAKEIANQNNRSPNKVSTRESLLESKNDANREFANILAAFFINGVRLFDYIHVHFGYAENDLQKQIHEKIRGKFVDEFRTWKKSGFEGESPLEGANAEALLAYQEKVRKNLNESQIQRVAKINELVVRYFDSEKAILIGKEFQQSIAERKAGVGNNGIDTQTATAKLWLGLQKALISELSMSDAEAAKIAEIYTAIHHSASKIVNIRP